MFAFWRLPQRSSAATCESPLARTKPMVVRHQALRVVRRHERARPHRAREHDGIEDLAPVCGHELVVIHERATEQGCLQPFAAGGKVSEIEKGILLRGGAPEVFEAAGDSRRKRSGSMPSPAMLAFVSREADVEDRTAERLPCEVP